LGLWILTFVRMTRGWGRRLGLWVLTFVRMTRGGVGVRLRASRALTLPRFAWAPPSPPRGEGFEFRASFGAPFFCFLAGRWT